MNQSGLYNKFNNIIKGNNFRNQHNHIYMKIALIKFTKNPNINNPYNIYMMKNNKIVDY